MSCPVTFYRMIEGVRPPHRADRSVEGTLPTRATRYCDAITSASGFGWWLYAPMSVQLLWTGKEIQWRCRKQPEWRVLKSIQFPGLLTAFNQYAPPEAADCCPPILAALPEPGLVQIWSGLIATTVDGWSLLIRPPANYPSHERYEGYEGIVETDHRFGPLFVNLRLTRTNEIIDLSARLPLAQVQPLPRLAYADSTLDHPNFVGSISHWNEDIWNRYLEAVVRPNLDPDRRPGAYAVAARKRRKACCPMHVPGREGSQTNAPAEMGL